MNEPNQVDDQIERLRDELHEYLGKSKVTAGWMAEMLAENLRKEGSQYASDADELVRYLNLLWRELRLLFLNLEKPNFELQTLKFTLDRYLKEIGEITGVRLIFTVDDMTDKYPKIAEGIFLVAREAISNSLQHANPNQVNISISKSGTRLILEIEDDGKGFDTQSHRDGYGIRFITKVVTSLGGELSINSELGKGTIVKVSVPID
jgi:signal transduction histidine kinase